VNKIKWLSQIKASDYNSIGDQALRLSFLVNNGYSVIDGLVITNDISRGFWEKFTVDWQTLDIDNYESLQKFAENNYQRVMNYDLATDLEASLFHEVEKLNNTTLKLSYSLVENNQNYQNLSHLLNLQKIIINSPKICVGLKNIWANFFDAKILFYCLKKRINIENIKLGILIQEIDVNDILVSGYVENQDNCITIRSSYGLINSINNGEILPDIYQLQKKTGLIVKQELGKKNIVYQINDRGYLEKKIVNETEQKKYSLNSFVLDSLEVISRKIIDTYHNSFDSFQWVIFKKNKNKVYIEEFITCKVNRKNKQQEVLKKEPLLSGLGASNGKVYGRVQVISGFNYHFQAIASGNILVTKNITPDWLPLLKKAAGIITEQGGITSHVAIIARELGIPAIVRAKNATKLLKTGEFILLNGHTGHIYSDEYGLDNELNIWENKVKITIDKSLDLPTKTRTKLLVNLSEISLINRAINLPIDGVGLIRADLILLSLISDSSFTLQEWLKQENKSFLIDKWMDVIIKFCQGFTPKPVFYRSLDWLNLDNLSEITPLSSQRGTLSYFNSNSLFELELEILARVQSAGYWNINLILPFVRSVDEFIFARNLVTKIGLNQNSTFQLLIMAEVPSVIFLLPEYVKAGVQGIAIGTNDLTQLLLGIEREKGLEESGLNAMHPAVLKAVETLIKNAKNEGIFTCICGQAPAEYPELIDYLSSWEIDAISVNLDAVEKTRQAIINAEKKLILTKV
jgi:pyruvate,water dikinase